MLAVHLVTIHLLAAAWTASEVSEEKDSYASRFYRWFSESSKSRLLFLVALSGLIDTLAQLLASRSLLWLSMIWWWMYVTQSNFLSSTSLAWSLTLHLLFCFSQEKPLRWKKINTHTHARTHTHTHTEVSSKCEFGVSFNTKKIYIYIAYNFLILTVRLAFFHKYK